MKIFSSVEIDQRAYALYIETETAAMRALSLAISNSILSELEVKIRYVPIIMDEAVKARYPARSRLERKSRVFNCCPQLPIAPFLTEGAAKERFEVYIDGMSECASALVKLGATQEQVSAFEDVLGATRRSLVSE